MLTSNETLELNDLIRPLNLEAIQYFASGEIPTRSGGQNTLSGKFVRIGNLMCFGTSIRFGRPDRFKQLNFIRHYNLLDEVALTERELLVKATEEAFKEPTLHGGGMNDAGQTLIVVDSDLRPCGLEISGESLDYGRNTDAVRERTIEIAQALVGPSIAVVGKD